MTSSNFFLVGNIYIVAFLFLRLFQPWYFQKKEDKLIRNPGQMIYNDALPKFNMEPEKGTLESGDPFGTIFFRFLQVPCETWGMYIG